MSEYIRQGKTIRELSEQRPLDQIVWAQGWVRSVRQKKAFSFLVLNDGSTQGDLQVIVDATMPGYEAVANLLVGSSISIKGKLVASQGKGQAIELQAQEAIIHSRTDETFPLQKKETSLEFLREIAHLRPRTNTFGAIFRLRNALAFATHQFFQARGFNYIQTPIITAVDAEGAGEMFKVTSLHLDKLPMVSGKVDYSRDYFGKETSLTVSGQLEAECLAMGLGKVYTFGPTFRSENSNTARHLSEFWMIEPEVAFADLDTMVDLGTSFVQFLIAQAFEKCPAEMEFLSKRPEAPENLTGMLQSVRDGHFKRITYTEAVDILKASGRKFDFPVEWGAELQTEHERFLCEVHFKSPVVVTDYPKQCKAFYMKLNPDQKTVRAMDVLVPGVGEIIGGSQREDDLAKLETRVRELGMNREALWWYFDLRKYGSVPHAGFGLGFERAIMYISGMHNIRDVIPFARTPRSADF